VLKELTANAGVKHNWWTIDLCFWPNAWPATKKCKTAVDKLNALVSGKRVTKAKSKPKAPKARKKAAPAKKAKKSGGRGKRR